MRKLWIILWLAMAGASLHAQPQPTMTQRRINELAAMVEQAQALLMEAPKLRKPNEPLAIYLKRLLHPLPSETAEGYKVRVQGYLQMFEQLAEATSVARKLPNLAHQTQENRLVWRKLNDAMNAIPAQSQKLRALWKATLQAPKPNAKASTLARLNAETLMMVAILAKARQQLRVALP